MNYYEHHLGDYMRDTAHLSMVEDCAYRRLLDAYYIREKPLPTDLRECCKLARAASKSERDAVAYVLREFFSAAEDGHHQARADAEIARFQDKQRKAKASADARWGAQRAQSEGNANADASAYSDGMRTHSEGNAPRARTPTRAPARPQSPVPSPQSPEGNPAGSKGAARRFEASGIELPPWLEASDWQRWCSDRAARKKPVTEEGAKSQLRKLDEFRRQGHSPAAVIEHSIAGGYQGLFAPAKVNGTHTPPTDTSALAAEVRKRMGFGPATQEAIDA